MRTNELHAEMRLYDEGKTTFLAHHIQNSQCEGRSLYSKRNHFDVLCVAEWCVEAATETCTNGPEFDIKSL